VKTLAEIETRLLAILSAFQGPIPLDQLQDMRELCTAGEPGIALENFASQLYEYEVRVDPATLNELEALGNAMKLDPSYWVPPEVAVSWSAEGSVGSSDPLTEF
jgi:hypothetical protein